MRVRDQRPHRPVGEIDRDGLHRSNLAGLRAVLADLHPPADACLVDGFRLGPLGAAAPRDRRRRRAQRGDRGRLDRREGRARPRDAPPRRALSALRLRLARRVHHARALARRPHFRAVASSTAARSRRAATRTTRRDRRRAGHPRRVNRGERRALRHYRLRGYRLLDANARVGSLRARPRPAPRAAAPRRRGEGEAGALASATRSRWSTRRRRGACTPRPQGGSRDIRSSPGSTCRSRRRAFAGGGSSACRSRRTSCAGRRSPPHGVDAGRPLPRPLRRTSSSRGPRPSSPSASGRSTSTGCTRTSASSSRSSSRRSSTATCAAGGRVLDPFAGSGTTLVQALESGRDAVGVDVAAFNCLLMRVKTLRYDAFLLEKELRDVLARRGRSRREAPRLRPRVVRAESRGGAPALPLAARGVRARRRAPGRARARSALGAADDAFRPRVPARAAARAVLVPQAPADVPPRGGGGQVPRAIPRSTRSSGSRSSSASALADVGAEVHPRRRDGSSSSPARSTASSPRRRTRDSSTTTSSTGTPTSCSASTTAASASSAPLRRDEPSRARRVRRRGSPPSSVAAPTPSLPGPRCVVVVNDRRELYPEILETSGLRLVDRLERHVNRRTGRRAGEYFESVFVAVREA